MTLTLPKTTRGGARQGAGRKAFDVEFEERKIICMWLCDWFARELGTAQCPATDAKCEEAVNNSLPSTAPEFETSKAQAGGMWAKARRGERPFNEDRMQAVMFAAGKKTAKKEKFYDAGWRLNRAVNVGTDHMTMVLLSLIALDGGLGNQNDEKEEFEKLQTNLHKSLYALSSSHKRRTSFKNSKAAALAALAKLQSFLANDADAAVELRSGRISIKEESELLASPYYDGESWSPDWVLNPRKVIKQIGALQFGESLTPVTIALGQTWAMRYETPIFSDSVAVMNHIDRLNKDPLFKLSPYPEFNAHADIDSFIQSV